MAATDGPWWDRLDRPEYVVYAVREREGNPVPDPDMLPPDVDPVDGWGPMHGFYTFFLDAQDCAVALPNEVLNDGSWAMYEAAREEGMRSLTDFAGQLVPVVQAIEAYTSGWNSPVRRLQ